MSKRMFIGYFTREEDILAATTAAREQRYHIEDVYTPYAVHGLDRALALKPSRLPIVCLAFGLFGAAAKLGFQIWTSAWSWPVNVGGKPLASVPAFVPVTFEITVLFAGLATVGAFFLVSGLRPGRKPVVQYEGVTDDRFALVILEHDASFDPAKATALCERFNATKCEERVVSEEPS